jgi:hypothetical protein
MLPLGTTHGKPEGFDYRFAVLAGEVIYQLRSTLDHLTTLLVNKQGGTPDHEWLR